jgi:hypothetical protein
LLSPDTNRVLIGTTAFSASINRGAWDERRYCRGFWTFQFLIYWNALQRLWASAAFPAEVSVDSKQVDRRCLEKANLFSLFCSWKSTLSNWLKVRVFVVFTCLVLMACNCDILNVIELLIRTTAVH